MFSRSTEPLNMHRPNNYLLALGVGRVDGTLVKPGEQMNGENWGQSIYHGGYSET